MIKALVLKILIATTVTFLVSCSSLHFKSNGTIVVAVGHNEKIENIFEVRSQRDFYLWGLYPTNYDILIDQELAQLGASYAVLLKIGLDDKKYWTSLGYQILTFGMYQPVYYSIIAKGEKTHE